MDMRQVEFREMIEAIKDADKNRDTLAATAGRATARNSIEEADDLFSQMDRIGEEMGADDAQREARIEVEDLMDDGPDAGLDRFGSPPKAEEIDFDARLEALKRAMKERD